MEKQPHSKTIFILGAGVMQIPAIELAKKNGWTVVCADQNEAALARTLPHHFLKADIKESELLINVIEDYNRDNNSIDGVFTCGTDFSLSVAKVARHFNLPGIDPSAAERATDKTKMRETFQKHNVNSPWFYSIASMEELDLLMNKITMDFPCVVKPVDSMGARGVKRINFVEDLRDAVDVALKFSRSGKVIIEDFIFGAEFSLDAIIENGEITITGIADRHIFFPPYFIEMGHTMPSSKPEAIQQAVIAEFKKGIVALGLTMGAAKGDIKWDGQRAVIGEIAARLSGGYMSGWTYPYSSGLYPIDAAMHLAMGESPVNLFPRWEKVSAERAFISIPGQIVSIEGVKKGGVIDGINNIFLNVKVGETVRFPRNNVEKCGNVISCDDDYEKAVKIAQNVAGEILVRLGIDCVDTSDFLAGGEEVSLPGYQFSFDIDSNKVWFNNICEGREWDFETIDQIVRKKVGGISSKVESFVIEIPPDIEHEKCVDWQGRPPLEALRKIEKIFSNGKERCSFVFSKKSRNEDIDVILTAYFWQAFLRGSVQGGVWLVDKVGGNFIFSI